MIHIFLTVLSSVYSLLYIPFYIVHISYMTWNKLYVCHNISLKLYDMIHIIWSISYVLFNMFYLICSIWYDMVHVIWSIKYGPYNMWIVFWRVLSQYDKVETQLWAIWRVRLELEPDQLIRKIIVNNIFPL